MTGKTKLIPLLFALLFFTSLQAQQQFTVLCQERNSTPVSSDLWGSFYELGFGRSDLLWGELLFNRDFENSKPISESNSWYQSFSGDARRANWWHSGYQEPKWQVLTGSQQKLPAPIVNAEYWPTGHGKYFVQIDNKQPDKPIYLLQDSIYLYKGVGYAFEGLFSNGVLISEEKFSANPYPIVVGLYPMGDFNTAAAAVVINVNTNQLVQYKAQIPAVAQDGWYSFAIEVPAGFNIAIDQLSLMPDDNVNGWKRAPVERIKNELRPKTMRMPGGCFTSLYNWRDGVGPRALRPVSYDTWWNCELVNDVGSFELVDLCRAIGAAPFFCIPVMFNNEFNAADWVDFCNNPNNQQRIAYGRKEPLHIQYWELENEPYRRYDAITYAEQCAKFAKAMKAKDPSIQIAAGNYWLFNKKFKEMLDIYGPYVDLVTNRGGTPEEMRNDLVILDNYNKSHQRNIRLCHTEFRAPQKRHKNDVDGLNKTENGGEETLFSQAASWEYAMNTVDQYIQFQNMGGSFFTANFTNLTDGWGENLLNNPREGNYLSAAGVAYALVQQLDIVYPLNINSTKANPDLVLQAAWNKERNKLTLLLLNFAANAQTVQIDLKQLGRAFTAMGRGYKIAPPTGKSFNSMKNPTAIKPETFSLPTKNRLSVALPSMSLYAIELDTKK